MYLGPPGLLHLSCSFFCKYKGTFISFLYLLLQQMCIEPHGALQGLGGQGERASALQGALPGGRGWEEGSGTLPRETRRGGRALFQLGIQRDCREEVEDGAGS